MGSPSVVPAESPAAVAAQRKRSAGCCRSAGKAISKRLKAVAFSHAERYRRTWFTAYMSKFVHKIGKMSEKEGNTAVAVFIRENSETLVQTTTNVLCSRDVAQNEAYLFNSSNRTLLSERSAEMMGAFRQRLTGAANSEEIGKVIESIVNFAFGLRKELNASTSIAKTKVREYWEDRIPPMIGFLGVLLLVQLLFMDYNKPGGKGWIALGVTLCGFAAGFVMVYLRLPHAVDASTKQKASDYYIAHKDAIGRLIKEITATPKAGRHHHEEKVQESFNVLSALINFDAVGTGHIEVVTAA